MTTQPYAIVDASGNVDNIILSDGSFPAPSGKFLVAIGSSGAGIGWTYANSAFVAPAIPTPSSAQLWSAYQSSALAKLSDADVTMARVVEAVSLGLTSFTASDVVAFVNYRRALRAIVSATSGDPTQALPTKPAYPSGT